MLQVKGLRDTQYCESLNAMIKEMLLLLPAFRFNVYKLDELSLAYVCMNSRRKLSRR